MNRWKMRGAAALAVMSLTVAACDQQPNDITDDVTPSPDMTQPTPGDNGTTDNGTGASPSP